MGVPCLDWPRLDRGNAIQTEDERISPSRSLESGRSGSSGEFHGGVATKLVQESGPEAPISPSRHHRSSQGFKVHTVLKRNIRRLSIPMCKDMIRPSLLIHRTRGHMMSKLMTTRWTFPHLDLPFCLRVLIHG